MPIFSFVCMNFFDFFESTEPEKLESVTSKQMVSWMITNSGMEELQGSDLVLLSAGQGNFSEPRKKLKELYGLPGTPQGRIIDLGHVRSDLNEEETIKVLENIAEFTKEKDATAFLLCNEEAFVYPWFMVLQRFRRQAEVAAVTSQCTLDPVYGLMLEQPFLHKLHFLGIQHSLCEPALREADAHPRILPIRLGALRKDILQSEPVLRNSDFVILRTDSLRFSDFQASGNTIPNGLFAEEICALARYAGFADRVSLCVCGPYYSDSDLHGNNAALIAQIIWHFMDGWAARCSDHPDLHEDFISYRCELTHERLSLLFFKSRLTERWWMEIPDVDTERVLVPCTYSDYHTAASGETPELFFRTIRNL